MKKAILLGALSLGISSTTLPQDSKKVISKSSEQVLHNFKDTSHITYYDDEDRNLIIDDIDNFIEIRAGSDANNIIEKGDLLKIRDNVKLEDFKGHIGIVQTKDAENLTKYIDSIMNNTYKKLHTNHQKEVYRKRLVLNILEHMSRMANKFKNNGYLEYGTKISDKDGYYIKSYSNHEPLSISNELIEIIDDLQKQIETNNIRHIDKNEGVADEIMHFYNKVHRVYEKASQQSELNELKNENGRLKKVKKILSVILAMTTLLLIIQVFGKEKQK